METLILHTMVPAVSLQNIVYDYIIKSDWVAKAVIATLTLFSVFSWAIILEKFIVIKRAMRQNSRFLDVFRRSGISEQTAASLGRFKAAPAAQAFRAAFLELFTPGNPKDEPLMAIDKVSPAFIQGVISAEKEESLLKLRRKLIFLATTGSVTPFIGLLGTVLGIIDAFAEIGIRKSASLATVAPGISTALVATAMGLFAAIPAVVAYNYFMSKLRYISQKTTNFITLFIAYLERGD